MALYWSSTSHVGLPFLQPRSAWIVNFGQDDLGGDVDRDFKYEFHYVRAVRTAP